MIIRNFALLLIFCFTPYGALGDDKTTELEERIRKLELAVEEKISKCELSYKYYATRHFVCDPNTVARSARLISGNIVLLECYYYQIQCFKTAEELE